MKKKIIIMICMVFVTSVLSGCATGPNMTKEQSEKIANYSTALLLKYDANYTTRLVDTAAIEAERALIAAEEQARLEAEQAAIEAAEEEKAAEESQSQEDEIPVVEDVVLDIDDTLGLDVVDIEYSYYEVVSQYPEDSGSAVAPAHPSEDGNQLFVVHFTVTNSSGNFQDVSIFDTDATFRLETNTMSSKNTFITFLSNDFANFVDRMESGAMQDLVLISEITDNELIGLENIYLIIKVNGESYRTKLQ